MMPDLGKYAVSVLAAYGTSLILLAGIVWISLWRGARVRDALRAVEGRLRVGARNETLGEPAATGEERDHG